MKNNETENQYLLLFRDDGWYTHLSAEELEAVIGKIRKWFEDVSAKGIVRGGQALGREGCVISGKGRRSINDGPFARGEGSNRRLPAADRGQPRGGDGDRKRNAGPRLRNAGGSAADRDGVPAHCPSADDGLRTGGGLIPGYSFGCEVARRNSSTIQGHARGGRAPFSPRGGQDGGDLDPLFGLEHLTLAEDVVPEALARALRTWPFYGVPENPSTWIMRTSRNLVLDVVRRVSKWHYGGGRAWEAAQHRLGEYLSPGSAHESQRF